MSPLTDPLNHAWTLVLDKLSTWTKALIVMLPNLVAALAVLFIFYWLGRGASLLVHKAIRRWSDNRAIANLARTGVRTLLTVAGLFVALGILKLDKTVTSLLAGVGVVGLALSFAFQDLVANFVSGLLISFRRPFRVGDLVETEGVYGVIERIDLRSSRLRGLDGVRHIVPNRRILEAPIKNHSSNGRRRVSVEVGVAYGDDLDVAQAALRAAIDELPCRLRDREAEVYLTGFGGSSIDLEGRFWVGFDSPRDLLAARSAAIAGIKRAMDDAALTIPFPIRTLDFGVVGGERLDAIAPALCEREAA